VARALPFTADGIGVSCTEFAVVVLALARAANDEAKARLKISLPPFVVPSYARANAVG
jgi:hypothetical protein